MGAVFQNDCSVEDRNGVVVDPGDSDVDPGASGATVTVTDRISKAVAGRLANGQRLEAGGRHIGYGPIRVVCHRAEGAGAVKTGDSEDIVRVRIAVVGKQGCGRQNEGSIFIGGDIV